MAEQKILNARFKMKYDTFENWQTNSEAVLLKGEIGVVEMPQSAQDKMQGTPPIVAMKVGDGVKKFSELPYVTALAGDVYSWAKAEQKPTYTATEIDGIDDKITEQAGPAITSAVQAATQTLEAKIDEKVSTEDFTPVSEKVDALDKKIGDGKIDGLAKDVSDLQTTVAAIPTTYAEKTHTHTAYQITDLDDKLETKADAETVTGIDTRVQTLESKIGGLSGAMHFKGVIETDPAEEDKSSYVNGDVVAYGNKEYVFKGDGEDGEFVELGDTTEISGKVTNLEGQVTQVQADASANKAKLVGIEDTVTDYVATAIAGKAENSALTAEVERATQAEADAKTQANAYTDSQIEELNIDQYAKTATVTEQLAAKAEKVHTHKLSELVDDEETVIVFDGGDSSNLVAE